MKTKQIFYLVLFQLIILLALIYSLFFKEESILKTEDLIACENFYLPKQVIKVPSGKVTMDKTYCSVEHSQINFNVNFTMHYRGKIDSLPSKFKNVVISDLCSKKDFLSLFEAVSYINFNFTHHNSWNYTHKYLGNVKFSKKDCERY